MKERRFTHVNGFLGLSCLGFRDDGTVVGYRKDGSEDPEPFTELYDLAYAEEAVKSGDWIELPTDGAQYPATDNPVLLASASVHLDPVNKRGQISRGAYIANNQGYWHLTHDGRWTLGIEGDGNWWDTMDDAREALLRFREEARKSLLEGV